MAISLATVLAVIGVSLGILEIAVFGFGTVFLLFIAIGCLLSSLLLYTGLLAESLLTASLSVAVISASAALLLWKPLKKLQSNHQSPEQQPNAFAGLTLTLAADLRPGESVRQRYSGVEWQVFKADNDDQVLAKGSEVEVVKTGVGKMWVQPR